MYLFVFKTYFKKLLHVLKILFRIVSCTKSIQECGIIRCLRLFSFSARHFSINTRWIKVCTLNKLFYTRYYTESCVMRLVLYLVTTSVPSNNLSVYKINICHILPVTHFSCSLCRCSHNIRNTIIF